MTRAAALALHDVGQAQRRFVLPAMSAAVCLLLVALFAPIVIHAIDRVNLGSDLSLYLGATERWLAGGAFYVVNPSGEAILYPPVALLLFVPFTVLPAFLWWAIPAGALAWAIARLRPHPMAWPVMTILALFSPAIVTTWAGNPVMWAVAALAVGCVVTGPAVLVLLKPSLFPFALMGANRRRWWFAFGLFSLACLPFGLMWIDWIGMLRTVNGSPLYSLRDVPLLAIPLVAWAGRHRELIEATRERRG